MVEAQTLLFFYVEKSINIYIGGKVDNTILYQNMYLTRIQKPYSKSVSCELNNDEIL